MAKRDLSTWIPKIDAANRLGVSARSIERLVETKKIRAALRPTPGKKAILVIAPEEIDRLAAEMDVKRSATPTPFLELRQGMGKSHAVVTATLFMSMEQAVLFSGLPLDTLQTFVRNGKLAVIDTSEGPLVRRRDLELL